MLRLFGSDTLFMLFKNHKVKMVITIAFNSIS